MQVKKRSARYNSLVKAIMVLMWEEGEDVAKEALETALANHAQEVEEERDRVRDERDREEMEAEFADEVDDDFFWDGDDEDFLDDDDD